MDDVKQVKPDPEGLRLLLNGKPTRDCRSIWATIWTTRWRPNARVFPSSACFRTAAKRIACARRSCASTGAIESCTASSDLEKYWK